MQFNCKENHARYNGLLRIPNMIIGYHVGDGWDDFYQRVIGVMPGPFTLVASRVKHRTYECSPSE